MVGAVSLPACESKKNHSPCNVTVEQLVICSTVSRDETHRESNGRGGRVPERQLGPQTDVGSDPVRS